MRNVIHINPQDLEIIKSILREIVTDMRYPMPINRHRGVALLDWIDKIGSRTLTPTCPFCHSDRTVTENDGPRADRSKYWHYVRCRLCGVRGPKRLTASDARECFGAMRVVTGFTKDEATRDQK